MKTDFTFDENLITGVCAGDEKAFEELVARYSARIFNLAFGLTGDRSVAEEITQDVFFTVWQKARQLRNKEAFRTWIYRITLNLSKEHFRRQYRRKGLIDRMKPQMDRQDNTIVEETGVKERLNAAIANLSAYQRQAFLLKYQEELKISEIARIMKCREGTVKTHIFRAVHSLRRHLENEKM
jgi:RNA polymerase sigma-70 factor (ECF subfamily)